MSRLKIVYALLALLLLAAACQNAIASQANSASPVPATAADVPRMRVVELKALLDAGEEVIVADARSATSYEESHIAGAISLPMLKVDEQYKELPKDAKIVFYCT
jgi:3-mercaptopyruvate sulfurtransferase SseA